MAQSQLEELMAMGYTQPQAKRALEIAGGDMEQAVGYLLMGERSRAQLYENLGNTPPAAAVGMELPEETVPPAAIQRKPGAYAEGRNKVQELIQMGYAATAAQEALQVTNGDMDQAISYLLMGESRAGFQIDETKNSYRVENDAAMAALLQEEELGSNNDSPTTQAHIQTSRPESTMYHATTMRSEADVPRMVVSEAFLKTEGAGPFCACTAASKFLNGGVVTAEFLNSIMEGGIELFRKNGSPDWDVAKILKEHGKSSLNVEIVYGENEPKEGVFLSHDLHHVLGIRKQLTVCRNLQPTGWQALILEIPSFESIMIALPPKGSKNKFWYIDFYPRTIFRVAGAYARVHSTLLQLEESLEAISNSVASSSRRDYENFKIHTVRKVKHPNA